MPLAMTSTARIVDAIAFAAAAHRDQRRMGADAAPYINHPIALLHILSVEAGIDDPDILCAAALHDYLEDCCGKTGQPTIEEGRSLVRKQFGDAVLVYVDAVTDDKLLEKSERKRQQIEHAGSLPLGARLVKLADKTANLRDISRSPPISWSGDRIRDYFAWAAAVVGQMRGTNSTLEALFDAAWQANPTIS